MSNQRLGIGSIGWFLLIGIGFLGCDSSTPSTVGSAGTTKTRKLLNVSYDPTRELYVEFNQAFAEHWKELHGEWVDVDQSHGGSGQQSRAVTEGLSADVVSLALSGDIDVIAKKSGLIAQDWQSRLPNNSSPYTSTIVFLVRKGNPKKITDWGDLVRDDLKVITPNPKTGGGARWNYLAAWGFALQRELGDLKKVRDPAFAEEVRQATEKAKSFIQRLYSNVPKLDKSARAATNTFIQSQIGDVLLAWENEAFLAMRELGSDQVEMVVPSLSIRAEPPVAVVDSNARAHGNEELAKEYLNYLYSERGQQIVAKNFYRPRQTELTDPKILSQFADVQLFEITDVVSGWDEAQELHFKDRTGIFDQVYQVKP
ncbi:MAG: sulfate ABC transporter substrate-binding protein [Planctomycetota bacterium]